MLFILLDCRSQERTAERLLRESSVGKAMQHIQDNKDNQKQLIQLYLHDYLRTVYKAASQDEYQVRK